MIPEHVCHRLTRLFMPVQGFDAKKSFNLVFKSSQQHPTRHQLYGHLPPPPPPSQKPSKLNEPDIQDTAGEAGTSS